MNVKMVHTLSAFFVCIDYNAVSARVYSVLFRSLLRQFEHFT